LETCATEPVHRLRLDRSADFQSAVSRISNPLAVECFKASGNFNRFAD
jgi:hypothetical protein